jgi:RNA polymerase sigma-70 factor (ECF subfamily)
VSFSAAGAGKPPGIQTGGSPVKRIEGTGTSRRKQEVVTEDADVLMERVRAHDADAFEALYDAHHRLVYGVALRMLGDAPGAEDVTQAVFVKVWTSPELFRGGNFGAWIVRITRNRALDVLRNRATRNEGELPEALPETEGIEDVAFARIDAQLVRTALAELPGEQREPIELGFFNGITHEEIARRSGIPLGTIKTRIRSGLRKLRSVLDGAVTA